MYAPKYLAAGWMPIPAIGKVLAKESAGFTGRDGRDVTGEDVERLSSILPSANIAIRLPRGSIGLDVDDYIKNGVKKKGAQTLASLEAVAGPLPDVRNITARPPGARGRSGIRLFRLPGRYSDAVFPGDAGPGLEIIQHHHRYIMAPPSINPETRRPYKVVRAGRFSPLLSFSPDDVPTLSSSWVRALLDLVPEQTSDGKKPRLPLEELYAACLAAESGQQRKEMLKFFLEAQRKYGAEAAEDITLFMAMSIPTFNKRKPWDRTAIRSLIKKGIIPDGSADSEEHALVFTPASSISPEAVSWAWEGKIPRDTLTLLAGAGGSAKSMFATWLAAEATNGRLEGCWLDKKVHVLWATIEADHAKEIIPRLIAAGADMSRVEMVTVSNGEKSSEHIKIFGTRYIERLREKVRSYRGPCIIILDPVLDVLDRIKTNDQQEVREALGKITAFCAEEGVLALGIAHFNKMTTVDSAIERVTGSAAFTQRLRAVLAFAYDEEGEQFVVSQAKNNWGQTYGMPDMAFRVTEEVITAKEKEIRTAALSWSSEGSSRSVDDLLGRKKGPEKRSRLDEAKQWLLDVYKSPGDYAVTPVYSQTGAQGILKTDLQTTLRVKSVDLEFSWPTVENAARELLISSEYAQPEPGKAGRPAAVWVLPGHKFRVSD